MCEMRLDGRGWDGMGWCCQRTQWSVPATCVSLCVCALAVYCYVCRNDLRFVCQLKKQTAAKHLQDVAHTPRCHRQASKKGHPGYGSSAKRRKMIAVWRGEGCGVLWPWWLGATVLAVCVSRARSGERRARRNAFNWIAAKNLAWAWQHLTMPKRSQPNG